MPRSRAAPLNDPADVVQRVGTVNHADWTHFARPSRADNAKRYSALKVQLAS